MLPVHCCRFIKKGGRDLARHLARLAEAEMFLQKVLDLNLNTADHFEDLGLLGRIILTWIKKN
jgi:hypothetical protein